MTQSYNDTKKTTRGNVLVEIAGRDGEAIAFGQ